MAGQLDGKRVAFLFAGGVEQIELTKPLEAVREAGGTPELISLEAGAVQMFKHLERCDTVAAEKAVSDADPSDYAGVVVPGGWPTRMRCAPTRTRCRSSAASLSRTSRPRSSATDRGC